MQAQDVDVIIAGGGLVGASLACALGQLGLRIAVIETNANSPKIQLAPEYDLRVFAITRASENIFRQLHVWERMQALRVSPFREMHVWEREGSIHFDSIELAEPMLGHIIEMQVMLIALEQRLAELPDVSIWRGQQIVQFHEQGSHMHCELSGGEILRSKLLVGADGAESQIRQQAGINPRPQPYQHHALVTTVRTSKPHQQTAWQRFLPTGPLAFLPLPEADLCSIVWSTEPSHCALLKDQDSASFCRALSDAFEGQLGEILWHDQRVSFPLVRRHVDHYIQPRLALVGDAAHTIHPLAGQGVNLGLLDAASLVQVIEQAYHQYQDFGRLPVLRRYERWRSSENQIMISAMGGFKQLFGQHNSPLLALRNAGLKLTHQLKPIKNHLMAHAMGLTGDLPKLAQRP